MNEIEEAQAFWQTVGTALKTDHLKVGMAVRIEDPKHRSSSIAVVTAIDQVDGQRSFVFRHARPGECDEPSVVLVIGDNPTDDEAIFGGEEGK